jgi:uncharacterized protein (DUF983 family)
VSERPSAGRILWRGLTRRCPRCGAGGLFEKYFALAPRCPRCALVFEREEGYWAGALAINIGLVFAVFVVVFAPTVALTAPDIPVVELLAVLVPVMVIGPIAFYPISKTLWMAIDRAFLRRLDR